MRFLRSIYAIPAVLLLIGAGSIALVWNVQNKWIGIPVFVFAVLCVLMALFMLQNLADAYSRKKMAEEEDNNFMHKPEHSPSAIQKRTYQVASALMIVAIIPVSFTGRFVENYIDWKPVFFHLLLLSPVIGLAGNRLWKRISSVNFEEKEKEHAVTAASFIVPILLAFHAIVLINQLKESPEIMVKKVFVQRKSTNDLKGNNYLFIDIDNKKTRFELKKKDFEKISAGDSITIHVKKGGLGYAFVSRFE